jgi:hypothetical protein
VRSFTYFDDLGMPFPEVVNVGLAYTMGESGKELFLLDTDSSRKPLLYNMATNPEFLIPLKSFAKRRLLVNLQSDFLVTLGTGAFLSHCSVNKLRKEHNNTTGIVAIYISGSNGSDDECAKVDATTPAPKSDNMLGDEAALFSRDIAFMRSSLNSCGWEKIIVNFNSRFPVAHDQIAALWKFTRSIDRFLGFHHGEYLMESQAQWIVGTPSVYR